MNEWKAVWERGRGTNRCVVEMSKLHSTLLFLFWLAPAHTHTWPHMSCGIEVTSHTWFGG